MKKILILFLAAMFISPIVYAWCNNPECKCWKDTCKQKRAELRKAAGLPPYPGDEIKTVVNESSEGFCYYKTPSNNGKIYFFKTDVAFDECPNIFQVGFTDKKTLKVVVLKDEFEADLEIFHRPEFETKENFNEFIEKKWGSAKTLHLRSIKQLK
jgi:hypothetical protein